MLGVVDKTAVSVRQLRPREGSKHGRQRCRIDAHCVHYYICLDAKIGPVQMLDLTQDKKGGE